MAGSEKQMRVTDSARLGRSYFARLAHERRQLLRTCLEELRSRSCRAAWPGRRVSVSGFDVTPFGVRLLGLLFRLAGVAAL